MLSEIGLFMHTSPEAIPGGREESNSELLSKFGAISLQEYVSKEITLPAFYGDLVNKLRRFQGEANFISSGSKIVKHLRRRQYDPVTRGL